MINLPDQYRTLPPQAMLAFRGLYKRLVSGGLYDPTGACWPERLLHVYAERFGPFAPTAAAAGAANTDAEAAAAERLVDSMDAEEARANSGSRKSEANSSGSGSGSGSTTGGDAASPRPYRTSLKLVSLKPQWEALAHVEDFADLRAFKGE